MSKQTASSVAVAVFLAVIASTVALALNLGLLDGIDEPSAPTPVDDATVGGEAAPEDGAPPSSLAFPAPEADTASTQNFPIDGVGDVTVALTSTGLSYVNATAEQGWRALVESEGPAEVKLTFVLIEDGQIAGDATFRAVLEGGQLRARIVR
ncbi:MAG: hypothetical protein HKN26_03900 [Acidimicrobiales bacterium]|nr:hypothetical protein [Acidimicrobiales bacterium]